jgi:hypothetical protein
MKTRLSDSLKQFIKKECPLGNGRGRFQLRYKNLKLCYLESDTDCGHQGSDSVVYDIGDIHEYRRCNLR